MTMDVVVVGRFSALARPAATTGSELPTDGHGRFWPSARREKPESRDDGTTWHGRRSTRPTVLSTLDFCSGSFDFASHLRDGCEPMRRCLRALQTSIHNPHSSYATRRQSHANLHVPLVNPASCRATCQVAPRAAFLTHYSTKGGSDQLSLWSESGCDDVEDQLTVLEERRQTFTTALQTLVAMTASTVSLSPEKHIRQHSSPATNIRTQNSDVCRIHHSRFWQQLRVLVQPKSQASPLTNSRIRTLFDDATRAKELGIEAYVLAVACCTRNNNYSLLRHLMQHAQANGIGPDIQLCNTVLGLFVNSRSLSLWSQGLSMFASIGLRADTSTWNQLLTLSSSRQKAIVLANMGTCNVPRDHVTRGILLPVTATLQTDDVDLDSNFGLAGWTPKLGDVLVGELLKRGEINKVLALMQDQAFPMSLDSFNQIITKLREVPPRRMAHLRAARSACKSLEARGIKPSGRTLLSLIMLGDFLREAGFVEMVYEAASTRKLVDFEMRRRRNVSVKRKVERRQRFKRPKTWSQWLRGREDVCVEVGDESTEQHCSA